jgi:putative nucleotide binding protein
MDQKEEYAIVLDLLPYGHSGEARKEPLAQLLGETHFTLLEVVPKKGTTLEVGERVYIGRDVRDKIESIRGRVLFGDLTNRAKTECEAAVRKIVLEREPQFVSFLNRAGAINIRSHSLEHLPSIGKKHLRDLLAERTKKPFESFEDVQKRVAHLSKLEDIFVQRILEELTGDTKYFLFVKAPRREDRV